jgi:hypothetical protein
MVFNKIKIVFRLFLTLASLISSLSGVGEFAAEHQDSQEFFNMLAQHVPVEQPGASKKLGGKAKGGGKAVVATGGSAEKFVKKQDAILNTLPLNIKHSIVFGILGRGVKALDAVINDTTRRDLTILSGKPESKNKYLGSIIDSTKTMLGRGYLLGCIARPIDDVEMLMKRQAVLIELESLDRERLNKCLSTLGKKEEQMLSFWNEQQLPGVILAQYWRLNDSVDETLNSNRYLLDVKSAWAQTQKLLGFGIKSASAVILPAYAAYLLAHETLGVNYASEFLTDFTNRFIGSSGSLYTLTSYSGSSLLKGVAALAAGSYEALNVQSSYEWLKADFSIDALLQKKLVATASFIKTLKELRDLIPASVAQNLEHFGNLDAFINLGNEDLQNLFSTLECATFCEESDYFFRRGNVLLAYRLLEKESVRLEIEKALVAMAEIDMFVSARQLLDSSTSLRPYCLAEYNAQSTGPMLALNGFWNPFITGEPTLNDLALGEEFLRNLLVTAANSAGKSTALRAVALNLILAQSLGIASAHSMICTPFSIIASYVDITDDIGNKASHYQAECDRVLQVQSFIEQCNQRGKFVFSIFDEPFSGTSATEGCGMSYAMAKRIGSAPNSICMIATHFAQLQALPHDLFAFYKLSMYKDASGLLQANYMLEGGVSDQHIAFDVARQRGLDDEFIAQAQGFAGS